MSKVRLAQKFAKRPHKSAWAIFSNFCAKRFLQVSSEEKWTLDDFVKIDRKLTSLYGESLN